MGKISDKELEDFLTQEEARLTLDEKGQLQTKETVKEPSPKPTTIEVPDERWD